MKVKISKDKKQDETFESNYYVGGRDICKDISTNFNT